MMNLILVHKDKRGTIQILTNGFKAFEEVTIFETKKGFARGGCVHNISDEYISVLEGRIKLVYEITEIDRPVEIRERYLETGESFLIRSKYGHYFISLTDSTVMEWGPSKEEKNRRHEEFRKVVEDINAKL